MNKTKDDMRPWCLETQAQVVSRCSKPGQIEHVCEKPFPHDGLHLCFCGVHFVVGPAMSLDDFSSKYLEPAVKLALEQDVAGRSKR